MPTIAEVHAALTAPGQPFEMEEVEIRGASTRTWKHAPPTLRAVLEGSRAHGDRDFLVFAEEHGAVSDVERTTFEQHYRKAASVAHRLIERFGIVPGERVA